MVAPAFGFSVGDFVQVIALIAKAAKALRETDGASSNFQQASVELASLHSVLTKVQSLQPTVQNGELIQKIHICGLTCHIPLARFIEKIRKFQAHLGADGCFAKSTKTSQHIKRNFRKIQWSVSFEKELAKLRASIGPQMHTIEMLLQLESLERIQESQDVTSSTHEHAEKLLQSVDNVKTFIAGTVATKPEIARLPLLLDGFAIQQNRKIDEVLKATAATWHAVNDLQAKAVLRENLLRWEINRIGITSPSEAVSLPMPSNETIITAIPGIVTQHGTDETVHGSVMELRFSSVLLAARKGIMELMMMLLCLFPAIQHLLRTFATVSKAPTLLLQDNIHLEDALGRTMSLPYEHFRYWPVLHARLRNAFVGAPGEEKVKLNQFHIMNMNARGELVLTRNNWDRSVFPGSRLAMSMLYQDVHFEDQICPGCSAAEASRGQERNTWNQW